MSWLSDWGGMTHSQVPQPTLSSQLENLTTRHYDLQWHTCLDELFSPWCNIGKINIIDCYTRHPRGPCIELLQKLVILSKIWPCPAPIACFQDLFGNPWGKPVPQNLSHTGHACPGSSDDGHDYHDDGDDDDDDDGQMMDVIVGTFVACLWRGGGAKEFPSCAPEQSQGVSASLHAAGLNNNGDCIYWYWYHTLWGIDWLPLNLLQWRRCQGWCVGGRGGLLGTQEWAFLRKMIIIGVNNYD